jgi:catechol 2,3-dioxygenase-like lactoylglutathione lyase family enzyme
MRRASLTMRTGSSWDERVEAMIKGVHHAAISVRDLDRSIEFYCGLLGMQALHRADFAGSAMERITQLPGTRGRAAMLRVGAQHLELFEFAVPQPRARVERRAVCEFGISHFCLEVADIETEYERLKAAGVEFHCAPQPFGPSKATYARDPDGNVFELLERSP